MTDRLTPEIEALIVRLYDPGDATSMAARAALKSAIEEAIRSAEAEAYERAAKAVTDSESCFVHTLARAAERVRALASKGE